MRSLLLSLQLLFGWLQGVVSYVGFSSIRSLLLPLQTVIQFGFRVWFHIFGLPRVSKKLSLDLTAYCYGIHDAASKKNALNTRGAGGGDLMAMTEDAKYLHESLDDDYDDFM